MGRLHPAMQQNPPPPVMNTSFTRRLFVMILVALVGVSSLKAVEASPPSAAEKLKESMLLPGVSLSQGVSEITGVAISPLLGVSAMGVMTYYKTEPNLRHRLPWYCHPGVWGTGLALILVCFLKDFLGAAALSLIHI